MTPEELEREIEKDVRKLKRFNRIVSFFRILFILVCGPLNVFFLVICFMIVVLIMNYYFRRFLDSYLR